MGLGGSERKSVVHGVREGRLICSSKLFSIKGGQVGA